MSGETYAAAVERIAAKLAGARCYPPNRNDQRRKCEACRKRVPAYQGTLIAGRDDSGEEFGICVHGHPCEADITRAILAAAQAAGITGKDQSRSTVCAY